MRLLHLLIVGVAAFIIAPAILYSQGPGGGGFRGMGGGPPSPEMMWGFLDKEGKGYIDRDQLPFPMKMIADKLADKYNLPNRVTKADMLAVSEKESALRMNGGGGFRGGPPSMNGAGSDRFAEEKFKEYDKNNDGKLSFEELSERMKPLRDKFDTDKDGFISLTEYKSYLAEQFGGNRGGSGSTDTMKPTDPNAPPATMPNGTPEIVEEKRPTILRVGKLPKDFPSWFAQMDTNLDGQVGLYEWRKGGRDVADFAEMDLDGDGLITPDEVQRTVRIAAEKAQKDATLLASSGSSGRSAETGGGGFPGMGRSGDTGRGGFPGMGRGPGGDSGGGFPGMGRSPGGDPSGGRGGPPSGGGFPSFGKSRGGDSGSKGGMNPPTSTSTPPAKDFAPDSRTKGQRKSGGR